VGEREDFKEISEIPFTKDGFLASIETRRALLQIGVEMEEEGGGWRMRVEDGGDALPEPQNPLEERRRKRKGKV